MNRIFTDYSKSHLNWRHALSLLVLVLAISLLVMHAPKSTQITSIFGPLSIFLLMSITSTSIGQVKRPTGTDPGIGQDSLPALAWREMADPALVFDQEGVVLASNLALEALLGRSLKDILGSRLAEILGSEDQTAFKARWLLETLKSQGWAGGFELSVSIPGKGLSYFDGTAISLHEGGTGRYTLVLRDVTERSKHERALKVHQRILDEEYAKQTHELAQKVAALGHANEELQEIDQLRSDLISLASHQIRAPLTNMLGAVESMQTGCSSTTAVCQRMFIVLRDQMARLNRLVSDVLSVARLESGDAAMQLEPISLMRVLDQVAEQVRARGHRHFHLPYRPILPLVMADRDRLSEVLINLLDNADKYSPAGSDVSLDVRPTETEVVVSVLDNGPGLQSENLDRVFEKFFRAEAGDSQQSYGYGLGLYICRLLVEAQGGQIWAANRPQGGASFSFSLPVANL
jgi:PAS domain S-box-containing protein